MTTKARSSGPDVGADPGRRAESFLRAPFWVALAVPAVLALLLVLVSVQNLDTSLFLFFNALPGYTGPALWAHLTILGDGLVVAVLFLPWIRSHPERLWGGVLGALVMVLILQSFKGMLSLPRPLGVLPPELVHVIGPALRRRAFPSGHTASFFLFAGIWALSTPRRWLSLALLLSACLVGISRVAVGVHWPSDVLGGALLGWSAAWVGLRVADRWRWGTGISGRRILGSALMLSALVLLLVYRTGYPSVLLFQWALAAACGLAGGRELMADARNPETRGFPSPTVED